MRSISWLKKATRIVKQADVLCEDFSAKHLAKLELVLQAAQFIPHPGVKAATRAASKGLIFYRRYQLIKKLKR